MDAGIVGYLAVLVGTAALALVLTPLALRYALHRQVFDHPNAIKSQESPVPYLGGLAIVASFASVVMGAAIIKQPVSGIGELAAVLGCGLALAVLGLLDDLKGLNPFLRLAVELAAAIVVWQQSEGSALFNNGVLDAVITVVWIVGVTNALNLLDNMDGLSAGVAAIASGWILVLAATNGQFLVATLAAALCGCSLGFLRSNFHPARIYMGDAGSLFLGFMLAVLGLKLKFDGSRDVTFFVPILVLGVPLFDTALVTVNRLLHGRSPLSGGRDHSSHRLVFVGLSVPVAVGLIYAAAVSLGWLAVVMSKADRGAAYILMGWVIATSIAAAVALSLVPVYDTSTRRHLRIQEVPRRPDQGAA